MKLLLIRHGDPDYEHDSLTETGWLEAELLADRLAKEPAEYYYVSCLGRARDTASRTMDRLGRTAEICDWLQEFRGAAVKPNEPDGPSLAWDWLPADLAKDDRFFDADHWFEADGFLRPAIQQEYDWVCSNFDVLLEKHGYRRNGRYYEVLNRNSDTLVFFCHFGLECVLLSHLLGISPVSLWQGFCAPPSSVTTVHTEERQEGLASFRVSAFGDTSHLYCAGRKPSFHARFCERWDDPDERH